MRTTYLKSTTRLCVDEQACLSALARSERGDQHPCSRNDFEVDLLGFDRALHSDLRTFLRYPSRGLLVDLRLWHLATYHGSLMVRATSPHYGE